MQKIFLAAALASLLSGCQLIEQLQGKWQTPSAGEVTAEQAKLDAQYERVKKNGGEILFNGEKYYKQTQAVRGEDPRFISLAVSQDRTNRKSLLSETFYLQDMSHEAALTEKYLNSNKSACSLQSLNDGATSYYACDGKDFQRFIAVVYKDKNILSFRSLKAYQQKPTVSEEKAIVKGLIDYPFDAIAR